MQHIHRYTGKYTSELWWCLKGSSHPKQFFFFREWCDKLPYHFQQCYLSGVNLTVVSHFSWYNHFKTFFFLVDFESGWVRISNFYYYLCFNLGYCSLFPVYGTIVRQNRKWLPFFWHVTDRTGSQGHLFWQVSGRPCGWHTTHLHTSNRKPQRKPNKLKMNLPWYLDLGYK